MPERYSHIRMAAKRQAVECLNPMASHTSIPPRNHTTEGCRETELSVSLLELGRRGRTRTCDPLLRRQVLYPPELRARINEYSQLTIFFGAPVHHERMFGRKPWDSNSDSTARLFASVRT